jgi:hypothetical protein
LDTVPDLVIGPESSPPEYLYRVQGLRGTPDGGLLVVDGGSREIRFFDSQGRRVTVVGGKGEGPGEFEDPVLVPWPGSDSLLFFDKRLPRFQVLSSSGEFARTIRHPRGWPSGRKAPLGATGVQVLFAQRAFTLGPRVLQQPEGLWEEVTTFFWYDPHTGEKLVVDSLFWDSSYRPVGGRSLMRIPFTTAPVGAVAAGGAFITDARRGEIREHDTGGRLRRILRVAGAERPVTREMFERRVDWGSRNNPSQRSRMAGLYSQMPIPDTLPDFSSLQVDELGWLWAELYEWDPARPTEWVVFDLTGRARGVIQTPPGLEIQSIGRHHILGVSFDEFEVEHVQRYRLNRVPEGDE